MLFYMLVRLGLKKTPAEKLPPPIIGNKHLIHHTDHANRKTELHHVDWDAMRQRKVAA